MKLELCQLRFNFNGLSSARSYWERDDERARRAELLKGRSGRSRPSTICSFVTPPKPFQRPTGTRASNSISSDMRASAIVLGQSAFSVPSMVLIAQPWRAAVGNDHVKTRAILRRDLHDIFMGSDH